MFSKELESLIQATLEDGKLEEYEKAALVKRATAEGADLTELEIYINSLLQKRQRELNQKKEELEQKYEKEKKEAFGRTCPNCGAQVPPLTLKCECGYEFTTTKSLSSIQVLSDKIEKVQSKPFCNKDEDSSEYRAEVKQRNEQIVNLINLHPVPNTKEDIIEFLSVSLSSATVKIPFFNTRKGRTIGLVLLGVLGIPVMFIGPPLALIGFEKLDISPGVVQEMMRDAWKAKFKQVLIKGRSLRGDPEFTQQLDFYENMLKKK